MKVNKFTTEQEWLDARRAKITGSKLHNIVVKRGNTKKVGFYQLIADRLGIVDGSEDGRDRGHELEEEAVKALSEATGIDFKTELVMWVSDENPDIAYSPDGYTADNTITAEVKNLSSARHLQIVIENVIPSEHREQMLQSFITNEKQHTHYFATYDNRVTAKPLHYIVTKREDVEDEAAYLKDYQTKTLEEVNEWVEKLAF